MVDRLAVTTDLRASLLVGSVAQGTCDEHSDIDLINYYDRVPQRSEFDKMLRDLGAEAIGDISPPAAEGFAARYSIEGIELQTGGTLATSLDERLDRIAAGDVDWVTAKVAMGLVEGVALHGADLIARWKERAAYPEPLRRREVLANLGFFPIWRVDSQLVARDAELFRRQMLLDGAFRVAAVLSAVNRVYFSTFQFKRAGAHFDAMRIKPERVSARLDLVADGEPAVAAEELRRLVEETKAIVRAQMPEIDVEVPWQPLRDGR